MTNTIIDDASAALTNMWKMRIYICISATKWNDENEKWKRWKWNEIFWWLLCLLRHVYKSKTLVPYTQWHNAWHTQALHLWFWYTRFSYKYSRVTVSVQREMGLGTSSLILEDKISKVVLNNKPIIALHALFYSRNNV